MADIELVIKLSEEDYKKSNEIYRGLPKNVRDKEVILKAIANGIPLEDIKAEIQKEISKDNHSWYKAGMEYCLEIIDKHIGEDKE